MVYNQNESDNIRGAWVGLEGNQYLPNRQETGLMEMDREILTVYSEI